MELDEWNTLGSIDFGITAISRFNPSGSIHRLDGVKVADNGADLLNSGTVNAASINVSPSGATNVIADVWTGTDADGGEEKGLGGESGGFGSNATLGRSTETDNRRVSIGTSPSTNAARLYGFSNELTVVPAPAPATLLAASAMALLRRRRTR